MPASMQERSTIHLTIVIVTFLVAVDCATAQNGTPAPPLPDGLIPKQPRFVEEESPSALKDLAARLTILLKVDCPEAEVKLFRDELTVRYRTQKFMVHGRSKTGEFAEQAHAEEGPKFRGFLLHVNFHAERPTRALVVPSDVQEPYWTRFVDDFAIGTGKDAGFASSNLSYNHGTDPKLLDKLRASLAADEKPARVTKSRKPIVGNTGGDAETRP